MEVQNGHPLFQRFAPIFFPSPLHRVEKRKVIQIDGFPITLLKEEGLLCSAYPL